MGTLATKEVSAARGSAASACKTGGGGPRFTRDKAWDGGSPSHGEASGGERNPRLTVALEVVRGMPRVRRGGEVHEPSKPAAMFTHKPSTATLK